MAAKAFDDDGNAVVDAAGELVILQPVPSMPLGLWGDHDQHRDRASYFGTWPGVWYHGDRVRFAVSGAAFVLERSDATLNRHGVRIGSALGYRTREAITGLADSLVLCIEDGKGAFWMPLFVQMGAGAALTDALRAGIVRRLRTGRAPRHVPNDIIAVPGIPFTLTGKKMQLPVRKLMLGVPLAQAASHDAAHNSVALDSFAAFAANRAKVP